MVCHPATANRTMATGPPPESILRGSPFDHQVTQGRHRLVVARFGIVRFAPTAKRHRSGSPTMCGRLPLAVYAGLPRLGRRG